MVEVVAAVVAAAHAPQQLLARFVEVCECVRDGRKPPAVPPIKSVRQISRTPVLQ